MSRLSGLGGALYRGDKSFNIIGKRRRFYALSGALIVISAVALSVQGLHLGIEFKGGSQYTLTSPGATIAIGRGSPRIASTGRAFSSPCICRARSMSSPTSRRPVARSAATGRRRRAARTARSPAISTPGRFQPQSKASASPPGSPLPPAAASSRSTSVRPAPTSPMSP